MDKMMLTALPFDIAERAGLAVGAVADAMKQLGEPLSPRERVLVAAISTAVIATISEE